MPRKPRMYLPGVPCHVVQRGNNRNACFFTEDDRRFYLQCLGDACGRCGVDLHAYVLMTNHVHLLMTPVREEGISKVMQSIGRRYVQHINARYQRAGTLWEGRHKSSLVDAEPYLLACYRYIEMNPVRAGIVAHPGDYPWSSYRHNAGIRPDPLIREHPVYADLQADGQARALAYRRLVSSAQRPEDVGQIRSAVQSSMPLGDRQFRWRIESALGRTIGRDRRGRPRRASGANDVVTNAN